jgi:hypothetical protein
MALPVPPNATCDIFRQSAPLVPAVTGVPCCLRPDYRGGQEAGNGLVRPWTHIMLVDVAVDIRDAYTGALTFSDQDTVAVPDQSGTVFKVTFVERVNRGSAGEHKRVFLDRQTPSWPTNNV